ncbi:MULE transposase [Hirsutella rhossiliensis]
MWKRFPEVISFDNTYNTNRFKLPLFQATDEGGTGRSVSDAQQQLCIFHINSNVLLNAKRKWKHAKEDSDGGSNTEQSQATLNSRDKEAVLAAGRQDEPLSRSNVSTTVPHNYRGVLEMWKLVVFAETKEDYEKVWVRLCDEFDDQEAILIYLYNTYLPLSPQWSQCFIKKHRNFGIRVTSGTEASNNNVKSYLLNGMNHLFGLIEAIEGMLGDQERDFIDNCAQDEVLTTRTYSSPGSDQGTPLRLESDTKQVSPLARTNRRLRRELFRILATGDPLPPYDLLQIGSRIATSLRGRPKNTVQPVPTKDGHPQAGQDDRRSGYWAQKSAERTEATVAVGAHK